MKHGKGLIILAVIFAAVMVLIASGTLWLASFVMTGERQSLEEAMSWQSERYDTSFYDEMEKSDYTVKSPDGYELHAELLKNPEPSDKYVILSHGYTDNRIGSLKYVQMYMDLGYNCIIYDLRGHGENEPTFTTYGIREGQDLAALVEDTRDRFPNASVLGIHGEDDDLITPENSQKMYDIYTGPKEIRIIPGAGHAYSILTDPETYKETVADFLKQYTAS